MYQHSAAYETKMLDEVQTHRLVGTVNGVAFTQADVIGVSYSNQCSDKNVLIGSAAIGTLKLTFLKPLLARGNYYNKQIIISDGTKLTNTNLYEDIPMGVYYIGEAKWTAQGMIDVKAYDVMSLLDKDLTIEQTSGYLYDFCKIIETETGAPFGMTRAECEALPNGDKIISPFPENDMTTFRDLASKLGQLVGGFATAARDGSFVLRTFQPKSASVVTIPINRRQSGSTFSDFETRFDAISYIDAKDGNGAQYIGNEWGYVMSLGAQPFLQYGIQSERTARATAIYNQVQNMVYTPFKVTLLPGFCALDLGDIVSFTDDYSGTTSIGCVMSIDYTYNKSVIVQCFGSNPNLKNAKSKTDNAVAGNSSSEKGQRLISFVSTNIARKELVGGDPAKEILKTSFSTTNPDTILTLTEVKFETSEANTVAEIYYYLNGEQILYVPTETYSEAGVHTMSLMYPLLNLSPGVLYTFSARMKTSSDTVIEAMNARQYIQGAGVEDSGRWDGYLDLNDEFEAFSFNVELPTLSETVSLTADYPEVITLSDVYDPFINDIALPTLTEEINVTTFIPHNYVVTEDGDRLVADPASPLIT